MAQISIHGIPNCDTVRKARAWFASAGVEVGFHDLRRDGCSPEMVLGWAEAVGWERLINRRGPSFRALTDAERERLAAGGADAAAVAAAHPTIIKRPVVAWGDGVTVGFDPADFAARLAARG